MVANGIAYLVLGCHRSGTSAMARVLGLARLGALPIDLLPPRLTSNPTGFWKAKPIVAFDDTLLVQAGGSWRQPPSDIATPARVGRAASLIEHHYAGPPAIVQKSPRLSLLAPIWHAAILGLGHNPIDVVMLRHPQAVAASLAARGDSGRDAALDLWSNSTLASEPQTREAPRVIAVFDDLLAGTRI